MVVIFTALTGAAFGFYSLVIVRFLFGAGEAGAFPNAARVVTRWFPTGERGFARGAITTTSMLGGTISRRLLPHSFAPLDGGGRLPLRCSWPDLERALLLVVPGRSCGIRSGRGNDQQSTEPAKHEHAEATHEPIPWVNVLASPNTWLLGVIMTAGATMFYMQFQWYPTYLKEARGLSEQASGWFTGTIIAGGALGCLVGGVVADFVTQHIANRRWRRSVCGAVMLATACTSLAGVRFSEHVVTATLLNSLALFCLQVSLPTWWTVVAEISGKHGAAMFGLMNSMGGAGVMIMNPLVGRVVDARQAAGLTPIECWRPVFDGVAVGLACGAVCWLLVDATRSIVERPNNDAEPIRVV